MEMEMEMETYHFNDQYQNPERRGKWRAIICGPWEGNLWPIGYGATEDEAKQQAVIMLMKWRDDINKFLESEKCLLKTS